MELTTATGPSRRARPLPPEARRQMIIDAVTPLLLQHGRDLTSKQIAEAAGIAEGTVFRAFGDKESLLDAAIAQYLDPEPLRTDLASIDVSLSLEQKILAIVVALRERFSSVFRIMAVLGAERPPLPAQRGMFADAISECLAPDAHRLGWPSDRIAHIIRLVTFAAAFPQFGDEIAFSSEELSNVILHGIIDPTSIHCTESH